jgi:phage-related baseplate assembly protein
MYKDLALKLSSLPEPTLFKIKTFDELLAENVAAAKIILNTNETEWKPLDSDPFMKKIRILTLRQLHNQADKNITVKSLLITTAAGVDLDHLGASKNIFRDLGEYPYTNFEFKLFVVSDEDITIPANLLLNSDDDVYKAHVVSDVLIPSGQLSAIGKVELEQFVVQSDVKTENLVTELTYALEIKQLDIFQNGAIAEDDDRYRLRIIALNDRYSTAGSVEAYKFFAYSSDSRIDDISIPDDNEVLEVNMYIASFDDVVDEVMCQRVYEACNDKYTRPIGDKVIVKPAEMITVDITGTIELFDLLKQSEINDKIEANLKTSFFIGQDFVTSDFMSKCHIDGVYSVKSDFTDKIVSNKQIIKIGKINFNYVQAEI